MVESGLSSSSCSEEIKQPFEVLYNLAAAQLGLSVHSVNKCDGHLKGKLVYDK